MADSLDVEYYLKGDEETKRLSSNHVIFKDAMGGLIKAPVDLKGEPLDILDCATADGTWIRDVAKGTAPVAHRFVGTDIDPSAFPADPPAGTSYAVQDINRPWPKEREGSFDLVHQRLALVGAGSEAKAAIARLAALVRPGGWIELMEWDNSPPPPPEVGPEWTNFMELLTGIFKIGGTDLSMAHHFASWLREDGFVNVQEKLFGAKMGASNPNPGLAELGLFTTDDAAAKLIPYGKKFPPGTLSISPEKLDTLQKDLAKEMADRGATMMYRVVWAQKPKT